MKKTKNVVVKHSVILNLIQDLQRRLLRKQKGSDNGVCGRWQIKSAMTSLLNNNGFTLIELLVVVLIIGILAAVAVPQYQKAVLKSRIAVIQPVLASLRAAEEVYYLANGEYTDDYAALDVDLPCKTWPDKSVVSCGTDWVIDLLTGNTEAGSVIVGSYCPEIDVSTDMGNCLNGTKRKLHLHTWLFHSTKPNQQFCNGTDELTRAVCATLVK